MDNREKKTNLRNTSSADGTNIPIISFAATADGTGGLAPEQFDIPTDSESLNFTAFYDAAHRLIFILDKTIDERTPNFLLVIQPDTKSPERKWDDILSNDYGLDLETVRPKIDNKYQKLDIEYTGLGIYNRLINAFKSKTDITDALSDLSNFREDAAKRAALARLDIANQTAKTAHATADKAKTSAEKLADQIKALKSKLSEHKKRVGKIPTKKSAANILKLESQIDIAQEKIKRARDRKNNALKRLKLAMDDAAAARLLLGHGEQEFIDQPAKITTKQTTTKNVSQKQPIVKTEPEIPQEEDYDSNDKPIKPLIEKNPNIIDDKIAFRPIQFDAGPLKTDDESSFSFIEEESETKSEKEEPDYDFDAPTLNIQDDEDIETPEKPLSENVEKKSDFAIKSEPDFSSLIPPENIKVMDDSHNDKTTAFMPDMQDDEPKFAPPVEPNIPTEEPHLSDFSPNNHATQDTKNTNVESRPHAPMLQTAPTENNRPLPPSSDTEKITQYGVANAEEFNTATPRKRPGLLYYFMLIALLALSVFTLWLYQKRSTNITPNLTKPVVQTQSQENIPENQNPFVEQEPQSSDLENAPSAQENQSDEVQGAFVETPQPVPVVQPDDSANQPLPSDNIQNQPTNTEPEYTAGPGEYYSDGTETMPQPAADTAMYQNNTPDSYPETTDEPMPNPDMAPNNF